MTEPGQQLTCPACRIIDRADGVEDGKLYKTIVPRVKNEGALMRGLRGVEQVQNRIADSITGFSGSMSFVYLHAGWFVVWIAVNAGLLGASLAFDRFPFGLLTMVVSLEAIFLSTFILISQNRQGARSEVRSQIDFENNLRGEIWAVHIGEALGIDPEHVEDVVRQAVDGYFHEGHLQDLE